MAGGDAFPSAFLDFVNAQAQTSLTIPTGFKTDGSPKRRHLWSRFFQGEAANLKKRQNGQYISYDTILSQRSSGESYNPGAVASPTNTQHSVKGTAYWRRHRWNVTYTDDELEFNGSDDLTQQWMDLWSLKQALKEQDVNDFMEDRFWAVPYSGLMEGSSSDSLEPYSIFAHVNEDASGLFGENWTGQTWTTKQGLNPNTAAYGDNMKPQQRTYSNFTPGNNDSLISAFHNMAKDIYWEMPQLMSTYWESDEMNKMVIITDRQGHTTFQNMIQASDGGKDLFMAGKQDPSVPDPQYYGIPITWNDSFGAAAVYDDGSNGLAAQSSAAITGPRFMWLNGNHICPVVKTSSMFNDTPPLRGELRPDTWVIYTTLKWNLVCTSYKRQGFISPATSL